MTMADPNDPGKPGCPDTTSQAEKVFIDSRERSGMPYNMTFRIHTDGSGVIKLVLGYSMNTMRNYSVNIASYSRGTNRYVHSPELPLQVLTFAVPSGATSATEGSSAITIQNLILEQRVGYLEGGMTLKLPVNTSTTFTYSVLLKNGGVL